ncbi:hypothetical protein [Flavobacterium olei]|uniref:hypothetical protein n=1 Tax=Flavobacterium olei TaxID=1886782 RepID=UPI003219642B
MAHNFIVVFKGCKVTVFTQRFVEVSRRDALRVFFTLAFLTKATIKFVILTEEGSPQEARQRLNALCGVACGDPSCLTMTKNENKNFAPLLPITIGIAR